MQRCDARFAHGGLRENALLRRTDELTPAGSQRYQIGLR
jgi:hypothetical protein